ncbi:hypothetical protein PO909_014698 [Leuciscus waleckii]
MPFSNTVPKDCTLNMQQRKREQCWQSWTITRTTKHNESKQKQRLSCWFSFPPSKDTCGFPKTMDCQTCQPGNNTDFQEQHDGCSHSEKAGSIGEIPRPLIPFQSSLFGC